MRPPPGVRLLHALRVGVSPRQRREHALGEIPAGDVERLQRLVGEVEHVTAGQVAMVGRGGEEHVGQRLRLKARPHGGEQAAFGAGGVADLDRTPEPAVERGGIGRSVRQRSGGESRRGAGAVAGHVREPVKQRAGVRVARQAGQQVHHAREHR